MVTSDHIDDQETPTARQAGSGQQEGTEGAPAESGSTSGSQRAVHIASGIRFLTIQNLVTSSLGFVFLTSLLRLLSPTDYGLYSSALLVTGIASSIAFFGLQSAATRFVAYMSQDEAGSRTVSRSIVVLSLVFASSSTIVFVLLAPTFSLYFTKSTSSAWIFAASGAWLFSSTIAGMLVGLVQGMRRYESLAKILIVSNLAMVCLTTLGLVLFDSVIIPIAAWIFYGVVVSAWAASITRKGPLLPRSGPAEKGTFEKVLRYSIPLGVAGVLASVTAAGDPLVVGGFMTGAQLGEYYAAIAISGGLGVILFTPLNTAFFPETSVEAKDPAKLSKGVRLAVRYTVLALVPVSFSLAALSRQTLNLFSGGASNYLAGNLPLQLMSVFFLFVAMQGILTSLLLSIGKTVEVMIIGIITAVVDIGLALLLVPSFGLIGATTTRVLADVVGFLAALYYTREYIPGTGDVGFQAKVFVSSAAAFAVMYALSTFLSDSTLTLVPYTLVGIGVMLVCARGLNMLTAEDKRYLGNLVPRPMVKVLGRIIGDPLQGD